MGIAGISVHLAFVQELWSPMFSLSPVSPFIHGFELEFVVQQCYSYFCAEARIHDEIVAKGLSGVGGGHELIPEIGKDNWASFTYKVQVIFAPPPPRHIEGQ
jgi:hypothetical protein